MAWIVAASGGQALAESVKTTNYEEKENENFDVPMTARKIHELTSRAVGEKNDRELLLFY